ncbi:MAG: hypothetical protein NXI22_09635 [bacterium]|nr:hypothetical protein [bacterium]
MIRFSCPKGHRLSVDDSATGKPGKCPKCGSKFFVPEVDENDVSPVEDDMIVFLCPNGHKLNGPKELQGKAGQCPHCNSKFRIPNYDEEDIDDDEVIEDVEELEDITEVAAVDSGVQPADNPFAALEEAVARSESDVQSQPAASEGDPIEPATVTGDSSVGPVPSGNPAIARQMAASFLRFWRGRRDPEQVEIGFSGQSMIVHFFDIASVEADVGRFAVRQDDGRHTVYLVSWQEITHVAKVGSRKLPADFTS